MDKEQYKSYHLHEPTIHKINVWNFDCTHCFLYITCDICRYKNRCLHVKHKNEICTVAQKVENLYGKYLCGIVNSFAAHDFFIDKKHTQYRKIECFKKTSKFLRMKYIKDENVRS